MHQVSVHLLFPSTFAILQVLYLVLELLNTLLELVILMARLVLANGARSEVHILAISQALITQRRD